MATQQPRFHLINRSAASLQEWTALADLVRRGVTLGDPIFLTAAQASKGSHLGCDFHLLDANGDEVDGGAASTLRDNFAEGYYGRGRLSVHRVLDSETAEEPEPLTDADDNRPADGSPWKMTITHGDHVREETFPNLGLAKADALRQEQTLRHGNTLKQAFGDFHSEQPNSIQYGTGYHWVCFDRITAPSA